MEKRTIIGIICMVIGLMTYWACGISDPKYVNYVEEATTNTTTPPVSTCDTEALQLFTSNVHAVLIESCAINGCHVAQPIAGSALSTTSASENRTIVKAYTGSDPELFFNKLSGVPTHNGGDLSNKLPLAQIKAWTDKEAECASEG